jgi:hypothetical protein
MASPFTAEIIQLAAARPRRSPPGSAASFPPVHHLKLVEPARIDLYASFAESEEAQPDIREGIWIIVGASIGFWICILLLVLAL